jgi:hypothetical protein
MRMAQLLAGRYEYSCRTVLIALALVVLAGQMSPAAGAGHAIPDDSLSYTVQVSFAGKPRASGFYLRTAQAVYFVTAWHVLYDETTGKLRFTEATLLSYARDPKDPGRNRLRLDLASLEKAGEIKANSERDVAAVRIATIEGVGPVAPITMGKAVTTLERAASGLLAISVSSVHRFAEVLVGNDVYIFGYPESIGVSGIPQIDYERPLLRKGIVAGLNPKSRAIILDCPVYGGNSGGPVLQVEELDPVHRQFRLIGIVRQFVPYEENWLNLSQNYVNVTRSNSGYSVAEPVDSLLELVGVEP